MSGTDALPDKPSQAEGDVGDDELSANELSSDEPNADGTSAVTEEVTGDSDDLEVNDG